MTLHTQESAHGRQLEKFARRGSASVVGAAVSAVAGIALVVIITNGFSRDLAGTLFAGTSAFLIVESFVLLGTDTGVVRWLPVQLAAGRSQDLRRTIVVSALPVCALSLVTGAALAALAPWLAPALIGSGDPEPMITVLRVLGGTLPLAASYDVLLAVSRGMGTMRPTVLVENMGRLAVQTLAVLTAYLLGAGELWLTTAWALPYLPALVVVAVWTRRTVRKRSTPLGTSPQSWRMAAAEFWSYTFPRAIARITQTALKRSDIVLVAALSSPTDAALYTAATRFVVFGQLLVQAVQQALAPQLSALFAREEPGAADVVFKAATVWSMIPSWPIYLVTAGFAPVLMTVFGEGYPAASAVVVILSLTMLFATACGPVDSVLLMAGRSWLSLANSVVALSVNVGLNLVLIPLYGITGAATAWAVAIVVRNLLPLTQVRRSLQMWPGTSASTQVAAGALLLVGIPSMLGQVVDLALPVRVAATVTGCLAYVAALWVLREPLGLHAFRFSFVRRRQART